MNKYVNNRYNSAFFFLVLLSFSPCYVQTPLLQFCLRVLRRKKSSSTLLGSFGQSKHILTWDRLTRKSNKSLLSGKESAWHAGDTGDAGLIPGSERSPGEENVNLLQFSCLENSMERWAWQAILYGGSKSETQQIQMSLHKHIWGKTQGNC